MNYEETHMIHILSISSLLTSCLGLPSCGSPSVSPSYVSSSYVSPSYVSLSLSLSLFIFSLRHGSWLLSCSLACAHLISLSPIGHDFSETLMPPFHKLS